MVLPTVVFDDEYEQAVVKLVIDDLQAGCCGRGSNGVLSKTIQSRSVRVEVTVEGRQYEYNNSMPEPINPDSTSVKMKQGQVVLTLSKRKPGSWASHKDHMLDPKQADKH